MVIHIFVDILDWFRVDFIFLFYIGVVYMKARRGQKIRWDNCLVYAQFFFKPDGITKSDQMIFVPPFWV